MRAAAARAPAVAWGEAVEPRIYPTMPERLRAKLEAGFELAMARVREVDSCRELFARLGADGLETLATGVYFPVESYRRELEVCGRNDAPGSRGAGNLAFTFVGGSRTFLCRRFAWVSTEVAATAVIHEALHHAGLTEQPYDRHAMSSTEITDMVEEACGF
ncbi:MAG TPA: hypothetical protein VLT32_22690 [Candidatus Sulfomarinibacteraceae bacterium]|nr:hypothetical protein [Candidatus Sulfomarinibacteraceae bacterium]